MFMLKVVFVILLCVPLLYIGIFLISKLVDEVLKKS